mmetsp:Transcript_15497/g.35182  ORF Transcript_15497/g.35182 Transcript_15497/m.35182 type:complete len:91 (-) Transcript_15497:9-281(-)
MVSFMLMGAGWAHSEGEDEELWCLIEGSTATRCEAGVAFLPEPPGGDREVGGPSVEWGQWRNSRPRDEVLPLTGAPPAEHPGSEPEPELI